METGTVYAANNTEVTIERATPNQLLPDPLPGWHEDQDTSGWHFKKNIDPARESDTGEIYVDRYMMEVLRGRSAPRTVISLYRQWVETSHMIRQVNIALGIINEKMNDYANDEKMCSQYEEALEDFNNTLIKLAPDNYFRFEGRSYQYSCTIRRTRTIIEETTVFVDGPPDADVDDLYEQACEDADQADEWEEVDSEVDRVEMWNFEKCN